MTEERERTEAEKAAKEIYWLLPRTLPEKSWNKEYLPEVSAIIQRLLDERDAEIERLKQQLSESEQYKQVAALLCSDVEYVYDIVNHEDLSDVEMKGHIKQLKDDMDEMISDPEKRKYRYEAGCQLFSLGGC